MADENAAYVIYGLELQSAIHFAMPVRNMLYDAIQYANQVERTAKVHRKNKDKADTNDEFLSGFYKEDMINIVTGSELEYETGKDEVSMCKAIQGIKEDARLEGARENSIETAKKLISLGKLTLEEIASMCSLSFEEVKGLTAEA